METVVVTHPVPNETHVVGKFNFCGSFRVVKPRAAGAVQPFLQVECESFLPHLLGAFTGGWGSKVGGSSRRRSGDKTADQLLSSAWTHRPPPRGRGRMQGDQRPNSCALDLRRGRSTCPWTAAGQSWALPRSCWRTATSPGSPPSFGALAAAGGAGLGGRTVSGKGAAAVLRGSGSRAGVRCRAPPRRLSPLAPSPGSGLRAPTRSRSRLPLPRAAGAGSVSSLHLATAAPLAGSGVWPPHCHWPPPETTPEPPPNPHAPSREVADPDGCRREGVCPESQSAKSRRPRP